MDAENPRFGHSCDVSRQQGHFNLVMKKTVIAFMSVNAPFGIFDGFELISRTSFIALAGALQNR